MKTFAVTIFLGFDEKIRFVPGVKNRFGIYVPIPEGIECHFINNPYALGQIYFQAAQNALNHYGEDLNMKKAKPKYFSFPSFKSQKDFNSKHHCIFSYTDDSKIEFLFLPWHNGEFALYNSDIECSRTVSQNSDYATVGQAILDVLELADKAYPKLNIFSGTKNFNTNIALPTDSVTLLFKNPNKNFYDKIKFLIKEFSVEEYKNDFCLISSENLSCLFENDNLKDLNSLANECEELICLCSYSTVGSYGFFHYKSGKCLRGYLSLDESGTVIHNIGEKSYAENTLNLKFPPDDDSFANDEFDEINHDFLEKILSLIIN